MSKAVTVAVPVSEIPVKYAAFQAASGAACDGPSSSHRHWFVMMGLYDRCLTRQDIKKPKNALVLKVLRDHRFKDGGIAVSFITASHDPISPMENDDAWVLELYERSGGKEVLLGRGISTELLRKGGRSEFLYWPSFSELRERQYWLTERENAFWTLPEEIRYGWKSKSSFWPMWADSVYLPVQTLAYAMLEKGLGQELHRQWLAEALPDPIRVLGFAESQIFSADKKRRNIGSNILATLTSWASKNSETDAFVKKTIMRRAIEIGMTVLSLPANKADHSMVHRFILYYASPADAQKLMVKLAENVFIQRNVRLNNFHQAQLYFSKMTAPFPSEICEAGGEILQNYERKYEGQYVLCNGQAKKH
ncbi:hypothetical protein [uncultured Roseibium sp.]|uniref:hypothetical protein n=1 Tax=uncultured Roseibium sp. TaxID=1936171 RepID=UPI0032164972